MQNPFWHYNSAIDCEKLINSYWAKDLEPNPEYFVNYLGLKIDTKCMPIGIRRLKGSLDSIPIPANWHADMAEWAAVLRAVDVAPCPNFIMGEMGCGWGCWMGNSGLAAKSRSFKVRLYGVDGDSQHVEWASETLLANGFQPSEFKVLHGVASPKSGTALFPTKQSEDVDYSLSPVFQKINEIHPPCCSLPTYDLSEIFFGEQRVDLLHVDIQGGEVDLVKGCASFLQSHVAYLIIGTHSRIIEGEIWETLIERGWILEIERPAIMSVGLNPKVHVDGVQAWRNPSLYPI